MYDPKGWNYLYAHGILAVNCYNGTGCVLDIKCEGGEIQEGKGKKVWENYLIWTAR
jgi:hypothetical protein